MDANLKRGNPRNLHVAEAFEFSTEREARDAEKQAHKHFESCAHQKEWFKLTSRAISDWFVANGAKRMCGVRS